MSGTDAPRPPKTRKRATAPATAEDDAPDYDTAAGARATKRPRRGDSDGEEAKAAASTNDGNDGGGGGDDEAKAATKVEEGGAGEPAGKGNLPAACKECGKTAAELGEPLFSKGGKSSEWFCVKCADEYEMGPCEHTTGMDPCAKLTDTYYGPFIRMDGSEYMTYMCDDHYEPCERCSGLTEVVNQLDEYTVCREEGMCEDCMAEHKQDCVECAGDDE
jgi:hypothetical protein